MPALTLREKLYEYIRVADEKKLKAIYMILEDEVEEAAAWWKNKSFISELDKRYKAWERGTEKGYSVSEAKHLIGLLKKDRKQK
jgi:hypothetical protein